MGSFDNYCWKTCKTSSYKEDAKPCSIAVLQGYDICQCAEGKAYSFEYENCADLKSEKCANEYDPTASYTTPPRANPAC